MSNDQQQHIPLPTPWAFDLYQKDVSGSIVDNAMNKFALVHVRCGPTWTTLTFTPEERDHMRRIATMLEAMADNLGPIAVQPKPQLIVPGK